MKAEIELPPPPQGGVACVVTNDEATAPSGIEVVDAVEDLVQDEVERKEGELRGVVHSANVNGTNHPNVASSHDDELAQVKRQCVKLKEALAFEREQRQTVRN